MSETTTTPKPLQPYDRVTFAWECEATQIPSGNPVKIPEGTTAMVTQTLGGNVTLQLANYGGLVQVREKQARALYREGEPKPERPSPSEEAAAAAARAAAGPVDEKTVWEVLKTCYDPEIPVNIVDLGLVYDMQIVPIPEGGNRVNVKMTLTAMGCGMGPHIARDAQNKLLEIPGITQADVQIVWDPPWNQSMISEEGKKRLGIY
jgi:probable FeS assembly SUF system protein SufT